MFSAFSRNKPAFIIFAVLAFDFITKFLTHAFLPLRSWNALWYPYGGIGVFKNFLGIEFSLVHATNKGAAWGMLSNYQNELLIFRIALIASLLVYTIFINKKHAFEIPFALIIGGAIGNVIDFFQYGHVVDMFHFVLWGYDFPVFNIADTAIFCGISLLFFISYFENQSSAKTRKPSKYKS